MSFILILSIFLAITSFAKAETIEDMATACEKEVGLSPAIIEKIENSEYPNDPSFKKYLSCLFKKLGVQDDAGNVSITKIINYHPVGDVEKQLDEANKSCVNITGNDDGEKAYNAYACALKVFEKIETPAIRTIPY